MQFYKKIYCFSLALLFLIFIGCIDDSSVESNTYNILSVGVPDNVRNVADSNKKNVHIGHDFPVDVTIDAEYGEDNVPVQFYLLHKDDVEEVDKGIGEIGDIRFFYITRSQFTTIDHINSGKNTYQLVLNIPAEHAKDDLTGDYKTGPYYVVAEVDKNEQAEIDVYTVYRRFRTKLNDDDVVHVTTEYMSKPDLSIEAIKFGGNSDEPQDVLSFTDVILSPDKLPGLPQEYVFTAYPSKTERTFPGTLHIKSSSSDALNVPIECYISNGVLDVKMQIYDSDMGGYTYTYYIPHLKANVTERLSLALLLPKNDGGAYDGVTYRGDMYDVRNQLNSGYTTYPWKLKCEINPGGTINESRFIDPNDTNRTYYTDGDTGGSIKNNNNIKEEDINVLLDKIDVEPNEGIMLYPYDKVDAADRVEEDKVVVIFWDGLNWSLGDDTFGAHAKVWEGMFFQTFSLYSMGVDLGGSVFGYDVKLVDTYLNAESHPNNEKDSGFELHVGAANSTKYTDGATGYFEKDWNFPITLLSKSFEKSVWKLCFKFTIKAGLDIVFTPGVRLQAKSDGSLKMEKYFNLVTSAWGDASVSVLGLAGVGVYVYLDVFKLELIQSTHTETQFNADQSEIKGVIYRNIGLYITGPTGYVDLYLEINYLIGSKRWSWTIWRFSCPRVPIFEFDLDPGSGNKWTTFQPINIE